MIDNLSITLAQLNPTVGDLEGNARKILEVWEKAESDLVLFPEMIVCGYPPEDLVLKPFFLKRVRAQVEEICKTSKGFKASAIIGCPWVIDGETYNVVHLIHGGKIITTQTKYNLPNYGVFDEARIFEAGPLPDPIEFNGAKLGVLICEDMWTPDVAAHLKRGGAEILLVPNASPFETTKSETRLDLAQKRVAETGLPLVYVNQVGGQDELVFDGGSFVLDASGVLTHHAPLFEADVSTIRHPEMFALKDLTNRPIDPSARALQDDSALIYRALVLGLRDYTRKNGFKGVLLGLSGGIDSALTAVIAVDALGAKNVYCVMMPSPFTSQDSLDDAKAQAEKLGCAYEILSIEPAMKAFESIIPDLKGVAHENMQSRARGLILMALSNSSGKMLLSTGNKSEMAVGYATLYGDMNGGFNVLKDLYKTQVYALSNWVNREKEIIPARIITKAPSAELRNNQTDQDSLPPYDVLDDILECLIEHDMGLDEIVKRGHAEGEVRRVWRMLDMAEYKRRQAPPGVKITSRSFGRDRRYPITNKFTNHE